MLNKVSFRQQSYVYFIYFDILPYLIQYMRVNMSNIDLTKLSLLERNSNKTLVLNKVEN